MKKVLLVAAVACLTLVSCKKDFTCRCVDGDTVNKSDDVVITGKMKKKDAKATCDAANTTYSGAGYSCTLTY